MAETTLQLGFVPKNRGEYQSTLVTRYYKDNVVQYNGSSYIADPVGWSESDPTATYVTIAPTDEDGNLNAGWKVFASGNNTFTTGEKVDNVGIDNKPTAESANLVKSGGVFDSFFIGNFDKQLLIDSIQSIIGFITGVTDEWIDSVNYAYKLVPINSNTNYLIQNNDNSTIYYALLTSSDHTTGDTPDYADGCTREEIQANQSKSIFSVNASYLFISTVVNNVSVNPSIMYGKHDIRDVDDEPTVGSDNLVKSSGIQNTVLNLFTLINYTQGYGLSSAGAIVTSANEYCTMYVEVNKNSKVYIKYNGTLTPESNIRYNYATYNSQKNLITISYDQRIQQNQIVLNIPENCKYIVVSTYFNSIDVSISGITLNKEKIESIVDSNTDNVPTLNSQKLVRSGGVENAILNLFTPINYTQGYGLDSAGRIVPSTQEYCTMYVEVNKESLLYIKCNIVSQSFAYLAFYTESKTLIGSVRGGSVILAQEILTIPDNCKYIAYSVNSASNVTMFLSGANLTKEEIVKLINSSLSELKSTLYDEDAILDKNITSDLVLTNIDDSNPPTTNYDGTWDWQNGYMMSNGNCNYSTTEISTRLVPCYPNTNYLYQGRLDGTASICFYDKNKKFISGFSSSQVGDLHTNITFTTPQNCFYVKATCVKSYITSIFKILYKGNEYISANHFAGTAGTSENAILKRINGKSLWVKDETIDTISKGYCDMSDYSLNNIKAIKKRTGETNYKSCYQIPVHIGNSATIRLKVKFPTDIFDGLANSNIFVLSNSNETCDLFLRKQVTGFINNSSNINNYPVPTYDEFLRTTSTIGDQIDTIRPDGFNRDILLGCDAMSFRFKGDCTQETNQDICLTVTSSSLTIKHLTDSSVIASYDFSTYVTMRSLYEKLLEDTNTGGVLEDFEVSMLNLEGLNTTDIIPCTVHLVSKYYKNTDHTETAWDAFPYYFTCKEKNRIYTIEILFDANCSQKSQVVVDGYGIKLGGLNTNVFLNSDCTLTINNLSSDLGVEVFSFEVDDVSKSEFPLAKVVYAEGVYYGLNNNTNMLTSTEKLEGAFQLFKDNGFTQIGFEDVLKLSDGKKVDCGKLLHFSHDDHAINVIETENIRNLYIKNGILPSFGMHLFETLSDNDKKYIKDAISSGWAFFIHQQDTSSISVIGDIGYWSYSQLVERVNSTINTFIENYGCFPKCWDYHRETENYNTSRYLKNLGFQLIFGATGYGGVNLINKFRCKRATVRDNTSLSYLNSLLDNYLCQ